MPVGYQINPHLAKDDDLGLGQGLAQVIDPNIRLQYYKIGEEQDAREQERKQKEQDAKDAQIAKLVDGLGSGVWQGVDDERIGKKINDLNAYTEQNIDKLRKGDIGARLEFDNKKRDIQNDAEMSNKQMKDYYATQLKTANNIDKYYPDEVQSFNDYGNTQRQNISPLPTLNQQFNTTKYYSDLGLKQKQEADLAGRKKAITPQEADAIIANDLTANNPALIAESKALKSADESYLNNLKTSSGKQLTKNEDLANQNPAKYQLATVTDFAQARHGKSIYGQWVTPPPQPNAYTALKESDKTNITHTANNNGDDLHFGKNNDKNEPLISPVTLDNGQVININGVHAFKDKDGNINTTVTVPISPEQKSENVKVEANNIKVIDDYHKEVDKFMQAWGGQGVDANGSAVIDPKLDVNYPPNPDIRRKPFSETVVAIPLNKANEIVHDNYKGTTNIQDALNGKIDKSKINYQYNDNTTQKMAPAGNLIPRKDKVTGKVALFDANTKQFVKWQ